MMIDVESLWSKIESTEFSERANLANGIEAFRGIVTSDESFQHLQDDLLFGRLDPRVVLNRFEQLSKRVSDNERWNPLDAAMSAYVLVLLQASDERVSVSEVVEIICTTKSVKWLPMLVQSILTNNNARPETGSMKFGDDWTGLFIRGKNAANYAFHLRGVLKTFDLLWKKAKTDKVNTKQLSIDMSVVGGLLNDLESCVEGKDPYVQVMKHFERCLEDEADTPSQKPREDG